MYLGEMRPTRSILDIYGSVLKATALVGKECLVSRERFGIYVKKSRIKSILLSFIST